MGKVLRTNADYTIKTGSGAGGSNQVILDSNVVRLRNPIDFQRDYDAAMRTRLLGAVRAAEGELADARRLRPLGQDRGQVVRLPEVQRRGGKEQVGAR